ncbi:MAG: hypothetical protein V4482_05410 [Pseudomonadota bacterium]
MKRIVYLRFAPLAFFAITHYFAAASIAHAVTYIEEQYDARCEALHFQSETMPHTTHINALLSDESKVADRAADDAEKEIILKAVMASVFIHGVSDFPAIFDKRAHLAGDKRHNHFEILRLTTELAGDLLNPGDAASVLDLPKYTDLYTFSATNKDVFKRWFDDVCREHAAKTVDGRLNVTLFGPVKSHWKTGYASIFVSTYNLTDGESMFRVIARLPNQGDRKRYVVIENPNWGTHSNGGDSNSPYTIRAHPIVNGNARDANTPETITITNGENNDITVGINELGSSVHTHGGTFSPNNKHLTELPERALGRFGSGTKEDLREENECYSFVSHVGNTDTLHIITGNPSPIVDLAAQAPNFDAFVARLSIVADIFGTNSPLHKAKIADFITGRI